MQLGSAPGPSHKQQLGFVLAGLEGDGGAEVGLNVAGTVGGGVTSVTDATLSPASVSPKVNGATH